MPRTILHLDMDSYSASVEQQSNPSLRGLPVGITGKPIESTIIVTASREGKKFGLKAVLSGSPNPFSEISNVNLASTSRPPLGLLTTRRLPS